MKKTRNILLAVTALFVAALIGCGMTDDATVGTSGTLNAQRSAGMLVMGGEISNFAEQGLKATPAASAAHTIVPLDVTDGTGYHYWLSGEAVTGASQDWVELTVDNKGTFQTTVAATAWNFILLVTNSTATPDDSPTTYLADAASMFIGYAYADLSNSTAAVKFTVRPDGLTAKTNVAFDLLFKTWDDNLTPTAGYVDWNPDAKKVNKITAKICNMITGAVIDTTQYTTGLNSATLAYASSTTVSPGTYNYILEFNYSDSALTDYWSDVIVIVPNRTDYDDVVVPDCLNSLPADVESLAAYWVDGSRDLPGREGFYKVNFQWDAQRVNNEKYFELEIVQLQNKKEEGHTDTAWTTDNIVTAATRTYGPENLLPSDEYSSGTLRQNAKQVTLYLPLGKAYFARIHAVNERGASEKWTYLTIPSGEADENTTATGTYNTYKTNIGTDDEADALSDYIDDLKKSLPLQACTDGPLKSFANLTDPADPTTAVAATSINTYRIRYHVNGGSYMKLDARSTIVTTDNVVYYIKANHLGTTPKALWAANADNLKRRNQEFSSWCLEATGALTTESELLATRVYKVITTKTPATPADGDLGSLLDTSDVWAQTKVGQNTAPLKGYLGIAKTIADDANWQTATGTTSAALEAMDEGGWLDDKNLDLYADYTGKSDGIITIEDAVTEYKFYADMITVGATKITNEVNAPTAKFKVSKTGSPATGIVFKVTVPETKYAAPTANTLTGTPNAALTNGSLYKPDINNTYYVALGGAAGEATGVALIPRETVINDTTTYKIGGADATHEGAWRLNYAKEKYDTLYMTIRDTRGNIMATKNVAAGALGAEAAFAAVKIGNWATMNYIVEFTAIKTTSGKTITRSVTTVMELVD